MDSDIITKLKPLTKQQKVNKWSRKLFNNEEKNFYAGGLKAYNHLAAEGYVDSTEYDNKVGQEWSSDM